MFFCLPLTHQVVRKQYLIDERFEVRDKRLQTKLLTLTCTEHPVSFKLQQDRCSRDNSKISISPD